MKAFILAEAQAKRSKALKLDDMLNYWLYDALICIHLGLSDAAIQSLHHAKQAQSDQKVLKRKAPLDAL
jgi:hypothetical protein